MLLWHPLFSCWPCEDGGQSSRPPPHPQPVSSSEMGVLNSQTAGRHPWGTAEKVSELRRSQEP